MTSPAPTRPLPASIGETLALLAGADYLADRSLATVLFLSLIHNTEPTRHSLIS
jgi:hypothetical protein